MSGRILVIEDDPASLELVSYLLVRDGHRVDGAVDGAQGLACALRNEFDLVLCDLQLPQLTGYEIIAQLHDDPLWKQVPVIAITAYSMPGDRTAALAAGFDGYLTKPINPETFLDEVRAFLPGGLRSR